MKRLALATLCLLLLAAPAAVRAEDALATCKKKCSDTSWTCRAGFPGKEAQCADLERYCLQDCGKTGGNTSDASAGSVPEKKSAAAPSPVPADVKAEIEKAMAANMAQKAENERQANLLNPEGDRLAKEAEEVTALQKEVTGTCPGVVLNTPGGAAPGPTTPQCEQLVNQLNAKVDAYNAANNKFREELEKLAAKETARQKEAAALIERMRGWGEGGAGAGGSSVASDALATCNKQCNDGYASCRGYYGSNCAENEQGCLKNCAKTGNQFGINTGFSFGETFKALPEPAAK